METISERIKFAMKARNMKQAELVRKTGISKGAFSSYLSGRYDPKIDRLKMIADALEVDINWLTGKNVPMQSITALSKDTTESELLPEYVFYRNTDIEYLVDRREDVYIGLMNECTALIPRFYILVNSSMNEMHILPLFFRKDSARFYKCPDELFSPEYHSIFTRDFESTQMELSSSLIYYYGIDTDNFKSKTEVFSYSQEKRCYEAAIDYPADLIEEFVRETEKEALYLKEKTPS